MKQLSAVRILKKQMPCLHREPLKKTIRKAVERHRTDTFFLEKSSAETAEVLSKEEFTTGVQKLHGAARRILKILNFAI